jgi:hypothetical protein
MLKDTKSCDINNSREKYATYPAIQTEADYA